MAGPVFWTRSATCPWPLQAKLLRVLQEGELERIGGRETQRVDVRILAATNKDLVREVQKGRFREDLYWRLKVVQINLPPLRRRTEDIPELVDAFIARFNVEYQKAVRHVAKDVLNLFGAYAWPGNVRELENCIRRAVIFCAGDVISEEHIELSGDANGYLSGTLNQDRLMESLKEKLETVLPDIFHLSKQGIHANIIEMVEETIVLKALEECDNNQVQAAKLLGISRNTLRHRLKKYNEKQDASAAAKA